MTEIDMERKSFFWMKKEKLGSGYLKNMSLEQKWTGILPMGFNGEEETLEAFYPDIQVGGLMYRADSAENIQDIYRKLQAFSNIPLLLAANTEAGGDGLAYEGNSFRKPMAVAATDDPENGYRMGYTACKEGAALGLNWSFCAYCGY